MHAPTERRGYSAEGWARMKTKNIRAQVSNASVLLCKRQNSLIGSHAV